MIGVRAVIVFVAVLVSACGSSIEVPQGTPRPLVTAPDTSSVASKGVVTTRPETSSSTAAPATSSVVSTTAFESSSWPLALDVLAVMMVAPEYATGYQRDLFPHWTVIDGCSTRDRVLIEESTSFAQVDPFGCRVVAGDWVSPFDGRSWDDPAEIQIDHLVALKEAWESGAWAWTEAERRAFANDLGDQRSLNAVTAEVNQAKSDLEPQSWMPPLPAARCRYLADWIAVKARWQLTMDAPEISFLRAYLPVECPDLRVEPWQTVAVSAPTPTVSSIVPAPETPSDVYFANCTEARTAGVAPIRVGEPGYRTGLDRDQDGVACE